MTPNMQMSQQVALEQKLHLTLEMRQSLNLLQSSIVEVNELIYKEYQDNPLMELIYSNVYFDDVGKQPSSRVRDDLMPDVTGYSGDYSERIVDPSFQGTTLTESLKEQISVMTLTDELHEAIETVIEHLDHRGYFMYGLETLAEETYFSQVVLTEALEVVQKMEPLGVGGRNLQECLTLQLSSIPGIDPICWTVVKDHLNLIAGNQLRELATIYQCNLKRIQKVVDVIKSLQPIPSNGYGNNLLNGYLVPEAEIVPFGDTFLIQMSNLVPEIRQNSQLIEMKERILEEEVKVYLQEKRAALQSLIWSVNQRKTTLMKLLEFIVEEQEDYLKNGEKHQKPMSYKDAALALNVHESTICRAVKNKTIRLPNKTIVLSDLFTGTIINAYESDQISKKTVKIEIQELIMEEDPYKPLSDQQITTILLDRGYQISRRTVMKYREAMGIGSTAVRRRF